MTTLLIRLDDRIDPAARYIGWTPVRCSVRLSPPAPAATVVRVRNRTALDGGKVLFRMRNSSQWAAEIELTVPADGQPVEFEVAGQVASTRDGDAGIEATAADATVRPGLLPLMVRVRKDANTLSIDERDLFLSAMAILNDAGAGIFKEFRAVHDKPNKREMHTCAAFLPWHRAFLLDVERELQRIHPAVTMPYWRYDAPAPLVFHQDFMGAEDGSGRASFSADNPLLGWVTESLPGVTRKSIGFDAAQSGANVLNEADTLALSGTFDGFRLLEGSVHTPVHVQFEDFMGRLHLSVRDPLFFLLHAAIDRLWASWQRLHDLDDSTRPAAYDARAHEEGHRLDDTMWPWNQVTGFPRPPSAPGGLFPESPTVDAPGPRPRIRDLFDYQGFISSANRLGYDYDDIRFPGIL